MTAGPGTLSPRLQEIADDFGALPDSDRLQLLLEFAQDLPPLPEIVPLDSGFPGLQPHYRLRPGDLTVVTGIPGVG